MSAINSEPAFQEARIEADVINESMLAQLGDEATLASDDLLRADLRRCIDALPLIPFEQERIREEIEREKNPVRRDFLWWQHDHVDAYVRWAAKNAAARLEYLEQLDTPEAQAEDAELCRTDVLHWFRAWAWTLDPRMTMLPVVPFVPFPAQAEGILWMDNLVRVRRSDGLEDKSRDEGLSWRVCALSVYYWLFVQYVQILFGSYKEELVDSKEKPDTLLEKCRFQLRRTPSFLLPAGFNLKRDMSYMSIPNPQTGALIAGAAPTENFGRAGRYSVVWLDELAAWRFGGYPQWTAVSQSSQSKIAISTPRGKSNQFADLRFGGKIPVRSSHWSKHPWKDQRWRDGQTLTMSDVQIAQEIEIDYEASQPGRIFSMWHEAFHVITWSEFEAVYGVRHIPTRWNLGRCQDVGTSLGHAVTTDWFARPPENDKLADTVFWYRSWVAPVDWDIGTVAEGEWGPGNKLLRPGLMQREQPLKEAKRFRFSQISWEAESERRTYEKCTKYPTQFTRIKSPGPNEGISQAQFLMKLLPEPHPFVKHPQTLEPLLGRPRLILIVDDVQGLLQVDESGFLFRTPAVDDDGLINPRFEFPLYHMRLQVEKDKPVPVLKPFKRDDNSMDNGRYAARVWGPPTADMTRREAIEQKLPEQLKSVNLPTPEEQAQLPDGEYSALTLARIRAIKKIEKEMDQQADPRSHRRNLRQRKPAYRSKTR